MHGAALKKTVEKTKNRLKEFQKTYFSLILKAGAHASCNRI
jgi:hypothetical protein